MSARPEDLHLPDEQLGEAVTRMFPNSRKVYVGGSRPDLHVASLGPTRARISGDPYFLLDYQGGVRLSELEESLATLRSEVERYATHLSDAEFVVCLNKIDLLGPDPELPDLGEPALPLSAATRQGVDALRDNLKEALARVRSAPPPREPEVPPPPPDPVVEDVDFGDDFGEDL